MPAKRKSPLSAAQSEAKRHQNRAPGSKLPTAKEAASSLIRLSKDAAAAEVLVASKAIKPEASLPSSRSSTPVPHGSNPLESETTSIGGDADSWQQGWIVGFTSCAYSAINDVKLPQYPTMPKGITDGQKYHEGYAFGYDVAAHIIYAASNDAFVALQKAEVIDHTYDTNTVEGALYRRAYDHFIERYRPTLLAGKNNCPLDGDMRPIVRQVWKAGRYQAMKEAHSRSWRMFTCRPPKFESFEVKNLQQVLAPSTRPTSTVSMNPA